MKIVMLSVLVQAPLEVVHVKVTFVPGVNPVTPDNGSVGSVTVAVPEVTVQAPAPTPGATPASVAIAELQTFTSGPASATDGGNAIFMITSSVETAHTPLVIVQRNVTLVPAVNPVTVEAGDVGVVMVAAPAIRLHAPVPTVGVFPAKVVFPTLQIF